MHADPFPLLRLLMPASVLVQRDVTNAAQDANGTSGAALTITKADDAEDFAEEDELAEDVAPALPSTLRWQETGEGSEGGLMQWRRDGPQGPDEESCAQTLG